MLRPVADRLGNAPSAVADFDTDYWDSFAIAAVPGTRARNWARLSLRGADGVFGSVVWHGVLGFDLADKSVPETMAGWHVTCDSDDTFVLDVDGNLMAGRLVFDVSGERLVWTTLLTFHRPAGRRVWAVAGNVHRVIAPRSLDRAGQWLTKAPRSAS
jgi:hypothetical protein